MSEQLKVSFRKFDGMLYRAAGLVFRAEHRRRSGHQFLIFGTIGVMNTAIDFGIYTYLTRATAVFSYETSGKYFANIISFTAATTFSFFCNRAWTFRRKGKPSAGEAVRFYAAMLSGLVLNTGALYLLVAYAGTNDLVAKLFATVCSMIWNFSLNKIWVFPGEPVSVIRAPEAVSAEAEGSRR